MLVLCRYVGEGVSIGDEITVTVVALRQHSAVLRISAPASMPIHRMEKLSTKSESRAGVPVLASGPTLGTQAAATEADRQSNSPLILERKSPQKIKIGADWFVTTDADHRPERTASTAESLSRLHLRRRAGESIRIGNDITVTVLELRTLAGIPRVRLGIQAPASMPIHRSEVLKTTTAEASRLTIDEHPPLADIGEIQQPTSVASAENESSDSTRWWNQIAAELRADREEERDVFGDIPEELLNRYLAGEASESERAQVKEAMDRDPELREALDAIAWALTDPTELPGEIPVVPLPIFLGPAQHFLGTAGHETINTVAGKSPSKSPSATCSFCH